MVASWHANVFSDELTVPSPLLPPTSATMLRLPVAKRDNFLREEHFSYDRPYVRPALSNAKVPMRFVCAVDEALNSSVNITFVARQHSRRSLLEYEVVLQGGLRKVHTNGRRVDAVQARKRACGYRSAKMHIAL